MNILYIALIISLACLGVRAVTDKGMIFYFLRKPFDRVQERNDQLSEEVEELRKADIGYGTSSLFRYDHFKLLIQWSVLYLMKPVFMCSTCMASLHTLIWFPILTGELFTYKLILVMLIVSIFNTIGWLFVNVMRKFIS